MAKNVALDYMTDASTLNADIAREISNIKRCEDMLAIHGITYDGDNVKNGNGSQDISPSVLDLIIAHEDFKMLERSYLDKVREVDYVMSRIQDPNAMLAVQMRFMDNMSFVEIAKKTGYTKEGARDLTNRTVEQMESWIVDALDDYRNSK